MKIFNKTISKVFNFKTIGATSISTTFSVNSCYNMVYVNVLSGRNPFIEEIFYAISTILEKSNISIDRNYPCYPYRFVKKKGQSGCIDYYIETDEINGFPSRRHIVHVSCNNKVNKIETDLRAFLYLMWSMELVEDVNGFFKPVEEKVKLACDTEMTEIQSKDIEEIDPIHTVDIKEIQMRDVRKEEGWMRNSGKPYPPVNYCNVVMLKKEE